MSHYPHDQDVDPLLSGDFAAPIAAPHQWPEHDTSPAPLVPPSVGWEERNDGRARHLDALRDMLHHGTFQLAQSLLVLVQRGHVYIARPPLFRVDAPARGKKPAAKIYALDDGELEAALDKLRKEGAREGSWSISRFKGLGEMSAEQLWETTLNPDTRRLLRVAYGALDLGATVDAFGRLMGKGEAASRRELMELHGDSVEVDI